MIVSFIARCRLVIVTPRPSRCRLRGLAERLETAPDHSARRRQLSGGPQAGSREIGVFALEASMRPRLFVQKLAICWRSRTAVLFGGIGGAWKLSLARVVPLRQIAVGIHEAAQPLVETVIACPVCVLAVVLFFVLFGVSK